VWMLNPGKGDLLIDAAKVEEIMGVPPGKVPDVMALMGDSIDNIPGARDPNEKPAPGERRKAGIGEVGARQLIQEYGSVEEAVRRAKDVKRTSYREALEKYSEFVFLSKHLATIPTDAPVALDLDAWKLAAPDGEALRALYAELGFSSLLRELAAAQVAAASLCRCRRRALKKASTKNLLRLRRSLNSLRMHHPASQWRHGWNSLWRKTKTRVTARG
jgi:DNA polymerase-1